MASSDGGTKPALTLKADYLSPGTSQTFSHPLPATSPAASTKEKTAYLSALRTSIVKLQEEVNSYLTTKMEEDKANAIGNGAKVDEKKEEDNYGEEDVEDQD